MPAASAGLHRHLDLVDTLSLNMRERAGGERPGVRAAFRLEARLMERYEAKMIAAADTASVVSEADRAATGNPDVAVIPNGVDRDAFPYREPEAGPPVLTFFGNLGYFHNVEPARVVAEQVLPLVRERDPDARLRIVGARPAPAVRALERVAGVEVAADVPDMARELAKASVAVLPMVTGSGIKNKLLEAFAAGLPVVTTPAGVAGIEGLERDAHCLVGDGPESLADATLRLLSSLEERRRLAGAAESLVRDRYSWERQAESLLALYEDD
jgi:glycosyltransferase involved in cell wall biosynthesis